MTLGSRIIFETATTIGAVPLLWMAYLRLRGYTRDTAYWWLAVALGISYLADTLGFFRPWLASVVYPVSQASLIGAVFLSRPQAVGYLMGLTLVGLLAAWITLASGPDILLHAVAWLTVAGIAQRQAKGKLQASLLVTFGLGWALWMLYVAWPGWWTWGGYQACRGVGTGLFCWAAWKPAPVFRVA